MNRVRAGAILVGLVVVAAAGPAAAQAQAQSPRGLTFEEIDNGWTISPDVRVTEVDGELWSMAGVYGGWLMDNRLLIGAGAYWLVDGPGDTDFSYVGPVVEWSTKSGGASTCPCADWSVSASRPASRAAA